MDKCSRCGISGLPQQNWWQTLLLEDRKHEIITTSNPELAKKYGP